MGRKMKLEKKIIKAISDIIMVINCVTVIRLFKIQIYKAVLIYRCGT
jgi:hypothetical protein